LPIICNSPFSSHKHTYIQRFPDLNRPFLQKHFVAARCFGEKDKGPLGRNTLNFFVSCDFDMTNCIIPTENCLVHRVVLCFLIRFHSFCVGKSKMKMESACLKLLHQGCIPVTFSPCFGHQEFAWHYFEQRHGENPCT